MNELLNFSNFNNHPMTTEPVHAPNTRRSILPLSFFALVLLAGCSGTPGIDMSGPIDAREVMRLVTERNAAIIAIEGYGSISIDSPEMSNSASISMKMLKPDSLQLDITGPFGVTVARSLVSSKGFIFYNGLENTVAEGPTTAANLRRFLRVTLEFSDILDILSGAIDLPATEVVSDSRRENDLYILTWSDKDGSREYSVDLNYLAIRRYIRRNLDGDIMEEVNYKDYRKRGDVYLAQIVSISRPPQEESLSLVFQNQIVNDYPVVFTFSSPKSARRVYY